jgi:hypothetical protein
LDSQTHYGNKLFLYEKLQNTEKWKLKEIKKEKIHKGIGWLGEECGNEIGDTRRHSQELYGFRCSPTEMLRVLIHFFKIH